MTISSSPKTPLPRFQGLLRSTLFHRTAPLLMLTGLTLALCLSGRVFTSFEGVRVKVVDRPVTPTDGSVTVQTTRLRGLVPAGTTAALILRITNSTGSGAFDVAVDNVSVCQRNATRMASQRIDCRIPQWPERESTMVSVTGPSPGGWTLDYLEVATHHGNTTGLASIFILPAGTHNFRPVPSYWALLLCIVIFAVQLFVPSLPLRRAPGVVHLALAGVAGVVLVAILVSPWISGFFIVASFGTVTLLCAVILAPRLLTIARWVGSAPTTQGWAVHARGMVVASMVAATFGAAAHHWLTDNYGGNYSGFLHISRQLYDANPLLSHRDDVRSALVLRPDGGYDGEFVYFQSFDPLMRAYRNDPKQYRHVVDAVPYRYGRIGFSLLTIAASVGEWRLFPAAMIWLVSAGCAVCAYCYSTLASRHSFSPAWGLLALLIPGFWQSIQLGLPEPIAASLLLLGIVALSCERPLVAGGLFGLSLLVRETGGVAVVAIAGGMYLTGRRRDAALVLGTALLPMLAWRVYVGSVLYPDFGLKGFLDQPSDLDLPFRGFADMWAQIRAGHYYGGSSDFTRAGVVFPLLVTLGLVVAAVASATQATVFSLAAIAYGLLAICLNYQMIWVHVGNGQRGTYELFVMLALCSVDPAYRDRRVRYALAAFWICCAYYVSFGAFDAADIRTALSLPY